LLSGGFDQLSLKKAHEDDQSKRIHHQKLKFQNMAILNFQKPDKIVLQKATDTQ